MMGYSYQQAPARGGVPVGSVAAVTLQRMDLAQPWGFRLQGGKDFRMELSVKKVVPNSPAFHRLDAGDAIVSINGYETKDMTHMQAQQMIKNSGSTLDLNVKKGVYRTVSIRPTGPVKFSPATAYGYR